jgi:hypothetical protein
LSLVRAPTLVLAGQYDRVTLPGASRALADALPDGRYFEFRRAAHAPFLSHTTEFAALVTEFLRGGADAITTQTILTSVDSVDSGRATDIAKVVGAAATAAVGKAAAGAARKRKQTSS